MRYAVFGQNACIFLCMMSTLILINFPRNDLYWPLIATIILTAAAADVFALLGTLAVERDWVKITLTTP